MRWEFKLPDIGEGVTEGEIVSWLVKEGDSVKEDQPMVEVMTDKATVTITSPRTGRIAQLGGKVGQVVAVHAVLVVFELGEDSKQNGATKKDDGPAATAVGDIREDLPGMGAAPRPAAPPPAMTVNTGYFNAKPLATPATRKAARDLGVDLKQVPPT